MSKKTLLAFAKKPVGAVMMRPILERLFAAGDTDLLCASRVSGKSAGIRAFEDAGAPRMRGLPLFLCRILRFDAYLSADFGIVARRARLKVHCFHGVSFRNHGVHHNALKYDLCLLPGPYMRRRFEELGIVDETNAHRFPVVGMPKLDDLARGRYRRGDVLEAHGLDPDLPTILYAPTWSRKMSSLELYGDDLLRALAALPFNVICKLHDNSLDPRKASRDWSERIGAHARPGFVLAREVDVVPLMAAADVLLSDASSVANEFTLLDRPILFMEIPDLSSRLKPKADLDTWGQKAGGLVSDPSGLRAAVEDALERPDERSEIRRALARDLFYRPGTATDRAVAAIRRALFGEDPAT